MGIHDRHYIRDESARRGGRPGSARSGGLGSLRMVSVNTWIIVTCVAVFVIDGFLNPVPVVMRTEFLASVDQDSIDRSALIEGDKIRRDVDPRTGRFMGWVRPLSLPGPAGDFIEVGRQRIQFMRPLQAALHFSTARGFISVQFWRFVGFQFLHASLPHILFNMVGLFFFGPMVEQYLGSKRYLAFYLLCGIFGALMFAALNVAGLAAHTVFGMSSFIPGLLFYEPTTPLVGASAGVFGVLMAGAFLAPNATVLVFFILPMRLATMAYALVVISLLTILFGGANAGGEAGHLGGAIAGFYFIRHPHHLHGFFDVLGRIDPTSHHYRRGRPGVRVGRRPGGAPAGPRDPAPRPAEVDRILDKVHTEGLASLTDREKRILREASEGG